jgi:hypothetical protein
VHGSDFTEAFELVFRPRFTLERLSIIVPVLSSSSGMNGKGVVDLIRAKTKPYRLDVEQRGRLALPEP